MHAPKVEAYALRKHDYPWNKTGQGRSYHQKLVRKGKMISNMAF